MTGHARSILPVFSFVVLLCISTSGSAQDAKPKPTGSISGHIILNSKGAAGKPALFTSPTHLSPLRRAGFTTTKLNATNKKNTP